MNIGLPLPGSEAVQRSLLPYHSPCMHLVWSRTDTNIVKFLWASVPLALGLIQRIHTKIIEPRELLWWLLTTELYTILCICPFLDSGCWEGEMNSGNYGETWTQCKKTSAVGEAARDGRMELGEVQKRGEGEFLKRIIWNLRWRYKRCRMHPTFGRKLKDSKFSFLAVLAIVKAFLAGSVIAL